MIVKTLKLTNFRNYAKLNVELSEGINIIYGLNGQGKTNLLEAIYYLGFTKSHRINGEDKLIKKNSNFFLIEGILKKEDFCYEHKIYFDKNKKIISIDGSKIKKISEYISKLKVIIFYPEDLLLIKGSPEGRRKFVNLELSQLSKNYYSLLSDFNKILLLRREFFKKNNENIIDINYLEIINQYFIDKSIYIYQFRKKFIDKINEKCEKIYKDISGLSGFHIKYKTNIDFENYEKDYLKEKIKKKLENNLNLEMKYKSNLFGPQKDDIEFYLNDLNLKEFGSQGQQRMAVLALKLSEISIFESLEGDSPIVLLDDVFSELDDEKCKNLIKYIKQNLQVVITTTNLNKINKQIYKNAKLIKINNGKKIEEV